MIIQVKRHWYSEKATIGLVFIDGVQTNFSLEDVARANGVKIPGKTAIQASEYDVVMDFSNRFQRIMPHIMDVPMFDGVRFHAGNNENNTEGCILIGNRRDPMYYPDWILDSKIGFEKFRSLLMGAADRDEKISLLVTNEQL